MLLFTIVITALGASSTFATPLLSSLWGSKVDVHVKEGVSPHLNRRDVNDASLAQLPTVCTLYFAWLKVFAYQAGQCRPDDLYELLTEPELSPAASAFCSIYIASSSLVRAIITPIQTVTTSVTVTGGITTTTPAA